MVVPDLNQDLAIDRRAERKGEPINAVTEMTASATTRPSLLLVTTNSADLMQKPKRASQYQQSFTKPKRVTLTSINHIQRLV